MQTGNRMEKNAMRGPQDFPRDSIDLIERKYATIILDRFPRYGEFWSKFIGGKEDPNAPYSSASYGLSFSKSPLQPSDIALIKRNYEEITMAHYTLFLELLAAHDEVNVIESTLQIVDPSERLFEHFKAFENLYSHMSNAINQVYHLWALLFEIDHSQKRNERGEFIESQTRTNLKNKLPVLAKRLNTVEANIDCYRNNYVHFTHGIVIPIYEGRFLVPMNPPRNQRWSQVATVKEWNETVTRSRNDLRELEIVINDLHEKLIYQLDALYRSKSVKVEY